MQNCKREHIGLLIAFLTGCLLFTSAGFAQEVSPVPDSNKRYFKHVVDTRERGSLSNVAVISSPEEPTSIPTPSLPREREIKGKDGAPMVFVSEGEFTMGTSEKNIAQWVRTHEKNMALRLQIHPEDKREWFQDEQPQHSVFLRAFYIDQYEVTTKRYQAFMNDSDRGKPKNWSRTIPVSQAEKPVVGVSWNDAQAYLSPLRETASHGSGMGEGRTRYRWASLSLGQ